MKKSTMKKKLITLSLTIMLAASAILTGCGSLTGNKEADVPKSTAMVLGAHDLFPRISFNTESVYSRIYDSCYSYGNVSGAVSDGDAFLACNFNITAPDKRIDNAKRKQIAASNTEQVIAALSAARAKTPEIDTLSAISLSARTLQAVTGESEKTLLIFDSGLSTASLLDFSSQNLIAEPVDSIVSQLTDLYAIPDLSGIDEIVWVGLGCTCGDQQPLTEAYRHQLQEIWKGILLAGGADEESITFDSTPITGEGYDDVPECSTVPVVTNALELTASEDMPEAIVWDGDSIGFEANSAVFIDEADALEKMQPVADYLTAEQDRTAYLFGTTATTNTGDLGFELSQERAEACKELLVQLGVEPSQVVTLGLGQLDHPLRVRDMDSEGHQIEEMAQKNRSVIFVQSGSPLVEVLTAKYNEARIPDRDHLAV